MKQRTTGKLGIAIILGATDKVTILGAGTAIGNGGDDFEWMDSWEIYSKNRMASGTSVPKLRGDALLVSKSEAASALISGTANGTFRFSRVISSDERVIPGSGFPSGSESRSKLFHKNSVRRIDS